MIKPLPITSMKKQFTFISLIALSFSLNAATFSDNFDRASDVPFTTTGFATNWVVQSSEWGIFDTATDGILQSDGSVSNGMIYNTSVLMAEASGESSTVRLTTNTGGANDIWSGVSFNVQTGGNDDAYYALRYRSNQSFYQVLERDNGGNTQVILSETDATVTFSSSTDYELTILASAEGNYTFTITESGSSTVLNPTTTFTDTTYTGGYAGAYYANTNSNYQYKDFSITTVPEPSTYAVFLGAICLGVLVIRRRK